MKYLKSGPRRALRLLQATAFVSTLDRFAMPPMLIAIANDLGAPLAASVTAGAGYFLAYGLGQPLWGLVTESIGRVATMRLTLIAAGVCTLASAAASTMLLLTVARVASGLFFGAAYPSSLTYLGDTVDPTRRQKDVASLMLGVAAGTTVAGAGAGLLADVASWRAAFLITGCASLIIATWLSRLPEPETIAPTMRLPRRLGLVVHHRIALVIFSLAFLEGAVILGALTLMSPAAVEAGAAVAVAGLVPATYGIGVLCTSALVGRLSQTWPVHRIIGVGAAAAVTSCGLLTFSQGLAVSIAAAATIAVAWTFMHSSLQTWATEVVPAARGLVMALFAGSLFSGSAVAAAAAAHPVDQGHYSYVFLVGAVIAVPLGLVATWTRSRWTEQ